MNSDMQRLDEVRSPTTNSDLRRLDAERNARRERRVERSGAERGAQTSARRKDAWRERRAERNGAERGAQTALPNQARYHVRKKEKEVYCESCIPRQMNKTIKCQICKSLHPGDIPKVSLDLDHFLKKHFPLEYDQRKETFQLKSVQFENHGQSSGILSHEKEIGRSKRFLHLRDGRMCIEENLSNVHIGIGCDICGMYPIIGKRYKCTDCKERIGFDMCRSCYRNPLKYSGRFNQQHTSDHLLLPDDSLKLANILRKVRRSITFFSW